MILLREEFIRGGKSSIMSDHYVKSDRNRKILYLAAKKVYEWAMSQMHLMTKRKCGRVNLVDIWRN